MKLSQKVAQLTSMFIDQYRLSAILKNFYGEFRMQGAFEDYIYTTESFREIFFFFF